MQGPVRARTRMRRRHLTGYDEEAGALGQELAWLRFRYRDYRKIIVPLPGGSFYWHLYHCGERVNGGLGETRDEAAKAAGQASAQHWHAIRSASGDVDCGRGWPISLDS